jgi:uncharacterized membrane protein YhaH (DUF805 family)
VFTSNIGRGRFFVYSAVILAVEIILVVGCIFATMGLAGLANSKPGSSREGLALAIFIVTMVMVVARSNIAWRRSRDAGLPKWLPGSYILFSVCFTVLQALTVLVYDFNGGDNSNFGLSLLGFAILGLWSTLQGTRSAGGGFDPDAFLAKEGPAPGPGTGERPAAARPQAPSNAQPVRTRSGGASRGFGKRGLA